MKGSHSLVASIGLSSSGLPGAEFEDAETSENFAERTVAEAETLLAADISPMTATFQPAVLITMVAFIWVIKIRWGSPRPGTLSFGNKL